MRLRQPLHNIRPCEPHTIRPYELFALVDQSPAARAAQVQIPQHRGAGGLTLLETFVVIAGMRVVSARRVFEFGTFRGSTTLNMALNVPPDGEVLTLDLDESNAREAKQHAADAPLTQIHLSSGAGLDFRGTAVAEKIRTLQGNSVGFDFSACRESIDFVFIDGGHDFETVRSDTQNALKMVRRDKLSCIMWHDYGNPDYGALTDYLDELSRDLPMFHAGDSMLCAWFNDPKGAVAPALLAL